MLNSRRIACQCMTMYGIGQLYLQVHHKPELLCLQIWGGVSHVQWLQQTESAQIQHKCVSRQAAQSACSSQTVSLSYASVSSSNPALAGWVESAESPTCAAHPWGLLTASCHHLSSHAGLLLVHGALQLMLRATMCKHDQLHLFAQHTCAVNTVRQSCLTAIWKPVAKCLLHCECFKRCKLAGNQQGSSVL